MKKFSELLNENLLYDTHAHLDINDKRLAEKLERAKSAGVEHILNMGTDLESSKNVLEVSIKFGDAVLTGIGIHPEKFKEGSDMFDQRYLDKAFIEDQIRELGNLISLNKSELLMIGEIGLDYYIPQSKNLTGKSALLNGSGQKELFRSQLQLSDKYMLPVSVHVRGAFKDAFEILKSDKTGEGKVVLHSFTGTFEDLKMAIDRGYYLGVNGIITYSGAAGLREVLKRYLGKMESVTPLDFYKKHIVFETDSPLLRPSNATTAGRENEPANVVKVYESFCRLIR